jgi:small multidrug resistance pump
MIQPGWIALLLAVIAGVAGTTSMKLSQGLRRFKPVVSLTFFYLISLVSMTIALKTIELSVLYAIWSGLGTVLMTFVGVFLFSEILSVSRILSIFSIVLGVIILHLY